MKKPEHPTGAVRSEASPPQKAQPKALRYTCWSRIKLDLPDAPEHILDDIYWSAVDYRDTQPETVRYLEKCGFRGVLWP